VDEMKDCVRLLLKSLAGERKLHAVFNKYNNSRFQNAGGYFGIFVSTYQHREDFGMIWE
jgi:succinate-acetate transporter protein